MVVSHQTGGLQAVDEVILFSHAPVKRNRVLVVVPIAVKPDGVDFAVVGQQFRQLSVHEVEVSLVVRLQFASRVVSRSSERIVGSSPVEV